MRFRINSNRYESARIHHYHHNAGEYKFIGCGPIFISYENEGVVNYYDKDDMARLMNRVTTRDEQGNLLHFWYDAQHDCSIHCDSNDDDWCDDTPELSDIEMITNVISSDVFFDNYDVMKEFYKQGRRLGFRGDGRCCGFHCSTDAKCITSPDGLFKIHNFFVNHPAFIKDVSRRGPGGYNEALPVDVPAQSYIDDCVGGYGDRYHQINYNHLMRDDNTATGYTGRIEFRCFKSTSNVDTIYAYIDFIETLIKCVNAGIPEEEMVSYIVHNNRGYLSRYIERRKSQGKWHTDLD